MAKASKNSLVAAAVTFATLVLGPTGGGFALFNRTSLGLRLFVSTHIAAAGTLLASV